MIKHLTNGEPINNDIEICDEIGDVIDYMDYDRIYYRTDNKYDFHKNTNQIRTKKFISKVPIESSMSTAIRK